MNEIRKKLILLFEDVNKFYTEHNRAISLLDFEKSCFDDIPIEQFFEQIFKDREFNTKVSKQYLEKTLSDYGLDLKVLSDYKIELQRLKDEEDQRIKIKAQEQLERLRLEAIRKKRKNIILLSISFILIATLGFYIHHTNKQKALEVERIIEQKEDRISFQRELIEDYLSSFSNSEIDTIMNYWAIEPVRYYDIKEVVLKEQVKSAILDLLTINSKVDNEILNIEYLMEGSFNVSIIQKIVNRGSSIERHTEKTLNIILNEENKIIQEFSRGSENIFYVSLVVRDYTEGRYVGGILNDKRSGYGEMFYKSGNIFKGQWINDERNGYGEMFYKNGDVFKGQWKGYNIGEGEMIYASNNQNSEIEKKEDLSRSEFYNWADDHPKADKEYAYLLSNNGKWYTNDNLLKNSYGLYEVNKQISQLNGFVYLGTYEGHSYFRSIRITYMLGANILGSSKSLSNKNIGAWTVAYSMAPPIGYLAEINTVEEQEYIQGKLKGSNKSYWIGLKRNDGKFEWISKTEK